MTDCGLTNLASCLPEQFFNYLVGLFNSPLELLLNFVKGLLTEPVNVNLFEPFWEIIVYVISLFYGLFMIFAGFNFMISGYDSKKRENAKSWIRNIVLMILFIQASFLIYSLVIEFGALLTTGVFELIDPNFFLIRADNFTSLGMQLLSLGTYLITMLLTSLLLGIRYLLVCIGVVVFPFGVFFYFIPPLQSYGKMILNLLAVIIFFPFFASIILFGTSAMASLAIFNNFGVILAVMAFLSIDLLMIFLIIFGVIKSAFAVLRSDVGKTATMAVKALV